MTKKFREIKKGVKLAKEATSITYDERNEGALYNENDTKLKTQIEGADREVVTADQTQTLTEKTLDNSNDFTVKDTNFTVQDDVDATKQFNFNVTSVSSATTRVFTVPNEDTTLVGTDATQPLTNKTIDADLNTVSNIGNEEVKAGIDAVKLADGSVTNTELQYINSVTSNVQDQIDTKGLASDLTDHLNDTVDAHDASAISNVAAGNLAATDIQGAVNELQSDVDTRALDSAVVHNTGNENVAGVKTFTDVTDSTTKDNGAVVVEGGVGIEKNLNVGGNVVITGGLQVDGTTTTVNSTVLDVVDANVTLNKGGNQAAADSQDAGITVEMSDATDAKVMYDSATTSKFKVGEAGSEKEIATISDTQILTNKTLSGNTASNLSPDGVETLTMPVATDTLVGKATTDILTNKTITSPVINTSITGTAILDEDTLVSDSNTQVATQQSIKAYVDAAANPSGALIAYAGSTAPTGWLLCYGQAVSRTTYASLFSVVGTTYGIGDGSTTFELPDLRGRITAGKGDMGGVSSPRLSSTTISPDADTLGANGGFETHTLSEAEMPSHEHDIKTFANGGSNTGVGANDLAVGGGATEIGAALTKGSDAAHNNVQPTIILNYIIRT